MGYRCLCVEIQGKVERHGPVDRVGRIERRGESGGHVEGALGDGGKEDGVREGARHLVNVQERRR